MWKNRIIICNRQIWETNPAECSVSIITDQSPNISVECLAIEIVWTNICSITLTIIKYLLLFKFTSKEQSTLTTKKQIIIYLNEIACGHPTHGCTPQTIQLHIITNARIPLCGLIIQEDWFDLIWTRCSFFNITKNKQKVITASELQPATAIFAFVMLQ